MTREKSTVTVSQMLSLNNAFRSAIDELNSLLVQFDKVQEKIQTTRPPKRTLWNDKYLNDYIYVPNLVDNLPVRMLVLKISMRALKRVGITSLPFMQALNEFLTAAIQVLKNPSKENNLVLHQIREYIFKSFHKSQHGDTLDTGVYLLQKFIHDFSQLANSLAEYRVVEAEMDAQFVAAYQQQLFGQLIPEPASNEMKSFANQLARLKNLIDLIRRANPLTLEYCELLSNFVQAVELSPAKDIKQMESIVRVVANRLEKPTADNLIQLTTTKTTYNMTCHTSKVKPLKAISLTFDYLENTLEDQFLFQMTRNLVRIKLEELSKNRESRKKEITLQYQKDFLAIHAYSADNFKVLTLPANMTLSSAKEHLVAVELEHTAVSPMPISSINSQPIQSDAHPSMALSHNMPQIVEEYDPNDDENAEFENEPTSTSNGKLIFGIVLVVLGVGLLASGILLNLGLAALMIGNTVACIGALLTGNEIYEKCCTKPESAPARSPNNSVNRAYYHDNSLSARADQGQSEIASPIRSRALFEQPKVIPPRENQQHNHSAPNQRN